MSHTHQPHGSALDNHGNTVAAWTTVSIIMLAGLVMAAGVIAANAPIVYVGAGLAVVGLIVGKVMSSMGYGASGGSGH